MNRASLLRTVGFWLVASMATGTLAGQEATSSDPNAEAQETNEQVPGSIIDIEGGILHTDNAQRTPLGPVEDTIYSVGARINVRHDGPIFDAAVDGDLDWVEYDKTAYDARVLGFFDALMSVSNRSGGLRWELRESYGQLRRNPYQAETLANYEEVNLLSTGPTAQFHLATNTRLVAYADFSRSTQEDSARDSDQWSVGVSLQQGSRPDAGLSIHLVGERNEFGEAAPPGSNFDAYVAFLRYEAKTSRTTLSVDGGYSKVESDLTQDDAPLLRLVVERTLGAATSMYLNAGQEFSTASNAMRKGAQDRVELGSSQFATYSYLATIDAFLNRYAELGFKYDRHRTRFTIAGTWNEERYVNEDELDRDSRGIFASITRQVRPTWSLQLEGSYRTETFLQGNSDSEESYLMFDVMKQIGRQTDLILSVQTFERSDSQNPTSNFDELRYGISFQHRLLERR